MSTTVGNITEIKPEAEPDGGHMIKVADFGGEPFEVWIRPDQIAQLIKVLQEGEITRAMATVDTARFPELTVETVDLAHQGPETALLVSTTQTGSLVLRMSEEVQNKLRSELDRLMTYRTTTPGTH